MSCKRPSSNFVREAWPDDDGMSVSHGQTSEKQSAAFWGTAGKEQGLCTYFSQLKYVVSLDKLTVSPAPARARSVLGCMLQAAAYLQEKRRDPKSRAGAETTKYAGCMQCAKFMRRDEQPEARFACKDSAGPELAPSVFHLPLQSGGFIVFSRRNSQ
jgi:hypothetical protein